MPRQSSAFFTSHSSRSSSSLFSMRKNKPDDDTTTTTTATIPLYNKLQHPNKGLISWPRCFSPDSFVHLIPAVIFLCYFILWWFSYPVSLNVKNGVIAAAYRDRATEEIVPDVDLAFPDGTSSMPPYPWIPQMPTAANETVIFD